MDAQTLANRLRLISTVVHLKGPSPMAVEKVQGLPIALQSIPGVRPVTSTDILPAIPSPRRPFSSPQIRHYEGRWPKIKKPLDP